MAKTYKAPSGLGSAVRGRSMVQRDYTSGVKFKAQEREADRAVTQANLGIVQQVAGGVAAASSALGDNLESHKDLETGARRVFESSGQGGTFEKSGFEGQQGFFKKLFTQAGEGSKTQMIGGSEFSTAELTNIGKADSVMAERMGTAIKNESGDITGYQSLFDSFKSQEPLAMSKKAPTVSGKDDNRQPGNRYRKSSTDIIKDAKQKDSKKNAVATVEVGAITPIEALNPEQAQVAQDSGAKTFQELADVKSPSTQKATGNLEIKRNDDGFDFSSIEGVETPDLPKSQEEIELAEWNRKNLQRQKEGSLSTTP